MTKNDVLNSRTHKWWKLSVIDIYREDFLRFHITFVKIWKHMQYISWKLWFFSISTFFFEIDQKTNSHKKITPHYPTMKGVLKCLKMTFWEGFLLNVAKNSLQNSPKKFWNHSKNPILRHFKTPFIAG